MPIIADFSEVDTLIDGMIRRGRLDDDTFYTKAADDLITEVERIFEVEGPDWAELAPMTVRMRIEAGYPGSHPIGEQSGDLKTRWFGGEQELMPGQVTLVNDVEYASKFHYGDPDQNQPPREIMFDEEFKGYMGECVANYVIKGEWDFGFGE